MFLDTTTRKLQVVLTSAKTSIDMQVLVGWVDITATTTTPGLTPTNTNGTTLVDILPAPAASTQRKVSSISIYNKDTAAKGVQVYLNDNGTSYQILDLTIQIDDTLGYTDTEGWYTQDLNGCRKVITSTQLGVANIWTAQQTFTQSSIVPSLPFNDNSTKEANTAFVQAVQGLNMATLPLANITGGTFSFAGLGSGCTLTYTVTTGAISSVTAVAAGGSGYAVGDCLLVSGGNYDSVIRVATITGSAVATVTILYGGTGYSNGTAVATANALADPFKWRLSGTLTSNATFILPSGTYLNQSDQYIIANNTTGAFTVSFFVSNGSNATTGTGVALAQGTNNSTNSTIETDGVTDVWFASKYVDQMYIGLAASSATQAVQKAQLDGGTGHLGETIESIVGATNAPTSSQWGDLTSISLSAGLWSVSITGLARINTATITGISAAGISNTAGNSFTGMSAGDSEVEIATITGAGASSFSITPKKYTVVGTTTFYFKMLSTYSAGVPQFYGRISATRLSI